MLDDGPKPSAELIAQAKKDGLTEIAVRRAKSRIGIAAEKHGFGKDGAWKWKLPPKIIIPAKDDRPSGSRTDEHLSDLKGDANGTAGGVEQPPPLAEYDPTSQSRDSLSAEARDLLAAAEHGIAVTPDMAPGAVLDALRRLGERDDAAVF